MNTVRYRLKKIAERTGCDLRRLSEVHDLLIAVHIARNAGVGAATVVGEQRAPLNFGVGARWRALPFYRRHMTNLAGLLRRGGALAAALR